MKTIKEIKKKYKKTVKGLDDIEELATWIVAYSDWLEQISKFHPFAKICLNNLKEIIPKKYIDF